jgi:hypothetical protein
MKSHAYLHATDAQWVYLKRLLIEAFAKRYDAGFGIDYNHRPESLTKEYAASCIDRLIAAKKNGWVKAS